MSRADHEEPPSAPGDPLLRAGLLQRVARNFSQSGVSPSGFWRSLGWRRVCDEEPSPGISEDIETGHAGPPAHQPAELAGAAGAPGTAAPEERSAAGARAAEESARLEGGAHSRRPSGGSPDSLSATAALLSGIFGGGRRGSGGGGGGNASPFMKRCASGGTPMCLICLENLTPEDFESGEAMSLECQCRGDLALRHRTCAEKWSRVKGDRVCDVCKAPIANLPELPPRTPTTHAGSDAGGSLFDGDADERNGHHPNGLHPALSADQMPGFADIIFDCIRVTWVAMIICILFFEMNLGTALWTGLVVGVAYTLFARAMYRQQLAALQREMAAEHAHSQQRQQPLPPPPPAADTPRALAEGNHNAAQPSAGTAEAADHVPAPQQADGGAGQAPEVAVAASEAALAQHTGADAAAGPALQRAVHQVEVQ